MSKNQNNYESGKKSIYYIKKWDDFKSSYQPSEPYLNIKKMLIQIDGTYDYKLVGK